VKIKLGKLACAKLKVGMTSERWIFPITISLINLSNMPTDLRIW